MYKNGPLYNLFWIFACVYLFNTFILGRTLVEKERFLVEHWSANTRVPFVLTIVGEIIYIFLSDIGVLAGDSYNEIWALLGGQIFIMMCIFCLIRYRFGPKTWQFEFETRMGLECIIGIIVIVACIIFFTYIF